MVRSHIFIERSPYQPTSRPRVARAAGVAQVELAPTLLRLVLRAETRDVPRELRRHGAAFLLQHHQPAVERVRERVVRALALELRRAQRRLLRDLRVQGGDVNLSGFTSAARVRGEGSEARGGRSCRSRGRGCRKWFPRRSIQRRGEKEQPGRGRTPVVRLLALCTSASRSLASKRFVRGKLSLPIRGRTMVGGRARRGVNDDWWRLELKCSETCRQKPGFIRPSIFDKSGRGPIDYV